MSSGHILKAEIGKRVPSLEEERIPSKFLPEVVINALASISALEIQRQADLSLLANSINSLTQSTEAKGVVDTKIAQHKIENNAHTASQVGADPVGTAAATIAAHKNEINPHQQYSSNTHTHTLASLGAEAIGAAAALNLNLGGKRHTRSRLAPTNPQIGDSWEELDANDQFVHSWFWNGVYWLSERIYIKEPSINNISSNLQIYYELPSDTNVFIVGFKPNVLLGSTNTTNSNWVFTLNRTGSSTVALATASSSATAPNSWFSNFVVVNMHVNVATTGSKAFRIDVVRNSVASNISGSVAVFYRLAKI